jgi:hypothetical protein
MPPVPAAKIMRAILSSDTISIPAEPSRRGDAQWVSGELEFRAWLDRTPEGHIRCESNVGDAKFAQAMQRHGRMSVMLRSLAPPRLWPNGRTPTRDDLDGTVKEFSAQFNFLEGRRDLCKTLAARSDFARGLAYAWLPEASYPARLMQALIIARDAGFRDEEESITERLRAGPIMLPDGSELDVMSSAKRWAKEYSKALGFEVPL